MTPPPVPKRHVASVMDTQSSKRKVTLLGVSPDTEKAHKKFIAKYELPFTLISDPEHKLADDYGVWAMKKFMGREFMGILRTTFVVDEKGKIERIIDKVDSAKAADQILTEA